MLSQTFKKSRVLRLGALIVLPAVPALAALNSSNPQETVAAPALPAFPNAEGFGVFATGGRGGEVYHVTNLDNAGLGSFRDAVSKGPRIVVFDVGGVVELESPVSVKNNITIAGQTAPGDGIEFHGDSVSFSNSANVIARYIRVRMGENGKSGKDAISLANGQKMIFDHVSVSSGRDETFSITGKSSDITIQNCIIGLGLKPHSAGGLIQANNISILRSLYINNHTRNPKVKGINQFVNNVIYNWVVGAYIEGDSAGKSQANIVGNYFIKGPNSRSAPFTRGNLNFNVHGAGNYYDDNRNEKLDGHLLEKADFGPVTWLETPFDFPKVTELSAASALKKVISGAGASLRRDAIDTKLIKEDLQSYGKSGRIIEREADLGVTEKVKGGSAPQDSDKDGMPDTWEAAHKLNPNNASDNKGDMNGDGYSNVENYLNSLVARQR